MSHASARRQAEVGRERKQLVLGAAQSVSQWADRGLRREVESGVDRQQQWTRKGTRLPRVEQS